MSIDLMLVDDDKLIINASETQARIHDLTTISFQSGVVALRYLIETPDEDLPRGYLVDMKLAIVIDENKPELEAPIEIFRYVKDHGNLNYFRFLTGKYSEHDAKVQGITDAKVILKHQLVRYGLSFFEELRDSKTGPL